MDENLAGDGLAVIFFVIYGSVICVLTLVPVVCFWRILERSGRSGPIALLMIIPLVNLGVMIWTAFGEWPSERKKRGEDDRWST